MSTRTAAFVATVAVVFAALLTSCSSNVTPPPDSGITGLVTIGPIAPVQREGEPADAPYSATLIVEGTAGDRMATVTSGTDGRFIVNLAPGTYLLKPQSAGVLPFAQTQEVTVEAHRFTQVTVPYDSGIR